MSKSHIIILSEIIVDSSNDTVNFEEAGASRTAILSHGSYFLYGDGSETGAINTGQNKGDFSANLKSAFDAAAVSATYSSKVTFDVDPLNLGFVFSLISSAGSVKILNTGTFDIGIIGHNGTASASLILFSNIASNINWECPSPYISILNYALDSAHIQNFTAGGKPHSYAVKDQSNTIELGFQHVSVSRALSQEQSLNTKDSFEQFFDNIRDGRYLRVHVVEYGATGIISNLTEATLRVQGVLLTNDFTFSPEFSGNNSSLLNWSISIREVAQI